MLVRGDKLKEATKKTILSAFIYRTTIERGYPKINLSGARVPAITDKQWLEEYAFYVTKDGSLDGKYKRCEPSYMAD